MLTVAVRGSIGPQLSAITGEGADCHRYRLLASFRGPAARDFCRLGIDFDDLVRVGEVRVDLAVPA